MFVFRFYWKDKIKKINPQKLLDLNKLIASKAAKNISHALAKLFSKEKQDFFKNKIPVLKIKDNALEKVIDKKKVFLKIPKEQFNALETGQYDSIFSDENKADNLSPEQENFTPTPAVSSTEISDEETNTSDDTKLKINRFIAEGQDDTSPSDVTISKSVDEPEKSLEESENEKISDIVKTTNDNSSKEPSNNLLGNPLDSPLSSIPSLSPLPPLSSETEEDSNFIADTGTMSTSEISEVPNQSELGDIDKNTDSHNSSETNNSSKIVTTFDKIPDVLNNENEKKLNENTDKVVANIEIIHFSIPSTNNEDSDQYIREMAQKLETVLNDFSIKAKVVEVATGGGDYPIPEITIEKGIRLSKITGLNDNIALSLAAKSVRIIAPIPGKSSIGIEIPNKNRKMISLRDVIDTPSFWEEDKNESVLPIALGKSISGRGVIADLASTPHLLVAGATGSGKSVCVNSIICSLLFKLSPQEVRFLMIDPKMVELAVYNDIPHLLSPVIIDPKKAALALRWVIAEMESRYYLLEKHKVRSIQSYNEMVNKKLQKKHNPILEDNVYNEVEEEFLGTLPYIVVIIDEFADLMMIAKKEIEDSVSRLAAMSRAVGIHLILATQRPSVDVITGVIKANFPSRIAFQVSSQVDSRTIIDIGGAETLLGKGDMLFKSARARMCERIQATFLSDEEVQNIVDDLKKKGSPQYIEDIFAVGENTDKNTSYQEVEDEYFNEALEIIMKDKKVSASYLQRKLKIGYNRAARIIELMEEKGIISPADGAKPRKILI